MSACAADTADWVGRSEGADFGFKIDAGEAVSSETDQQFYAIFKAIER